MPRCVRSSKQEPGACHTRAIRQGAQGVATVTHGQVSASDQHRRSRRSARKPSDRTSKLVMRVRFPSSALKVSGLIKALIRVFEAGLAGRLIAFRAINGPLADRHQHARRAVVIVLAPVLGFDVSVDVAGNDLVRAACLMLVDQGGPL
jgi:hypothetical protein